MLQTPNYLENKICLNVLANTVENAIECYHAAEGHIVLGVLSKNYATDEEAIKAMKEYQKATKNALSIGLGAGDPNQSQMVSRLAKEIQPQHVNQVFTGVGITRALLGQNETIVNGLISPTGEVGYGNIATGPLSSTGPVAKIPIEAAIQLLKDMGASFVKFFPMNGLACKEEYQAVAKACAKENFILEPTGGIDLENFADIIQIALKAGVKQVIPHIYSSIIDPLTGDTRPTQVKQLFALSKKILSEI